MTAPIVIAHRGVPGHRLEHTRPSYELGIAEGADYIEPDVVSTKDRILVVRHENEIGGTTDVAAHPEFVDRRVTKLVDGEQLTGWFTEDFTLAELKTLRAKERIPELRPQNTALAGQEQILTFDEVLDIAEQSERELPVGVYVETKHPTYFAGLGIDLNDLLIEVLERRGQNHSDAKVIIQSMEMGNLRRLRPRTALTLIQLMELGTAPYDLVAAGDTRGYDDLTGADELKTIAEYADGIGPHKGMVISRDKNACLDADTGLVDRAHAAGLLVHIWTMRDENHFLPADFRTSTVDGEVGDAEAEYLRFFAVGIDGVFSDYTESAVAARSVFLAGGR